MDTLLLLLVGVVPIVFVIGFMVFEIVSYKEPPRDISRSDDWRASNVNSAMQNDMGGRKVKRSARCCSSHVQCSYV